MKRPKPAVPAPTHATVCTRYDLIISIFPAGPHRCYSPNHFKKTVPIPKTPLHAIYTKLFTYKKNKDLCLNIVNIDNMEKYCINLRDSCQHHPG